MKLGLDYHGCITANPKMFSTLTKVLRGFKWQIHIITGSRITDDLKRKLEEYGIEYTHLFSISDHHFKRGTPMSGYEDYQPKISEEIWDQTKADYCREHNIGVHIDDSEVYGKYFTTPYLRYCHEGEEIDPGMFTYSIFQMVRLLAK